MRRDSRNTLFLWGGFGILIVGSLVGLFYLAKMGAPSQAGNLSMAVSADDISTGPADAKVTLVEYSDFQCPACGAYHPLLKQLNQALGNKFKFVYRYFPLTTIHVNAGSSARAAEAARNQGKFWEMHDMLFEHQSDWATSPNAKDIFIHYAKSLGLDTARFEADYASKEVQDKINRDYQSGIESRVQGTPTFFLNGKAIQNPQSYGAFKQLIESAAGS